MKKQKRIEAVLKLSCVTALVAIFSFVGGNLSAEELTQERQLEIINNYMIVTGQSQSEALSTSDQPPIKCGTPAVMEFISNYDKLDPQLLKSTGVELATRPDFLTDTLDTPGGHFRLFYTTQGDDAIWNGFPGYIDSVAAIFDAVYDNMINQMGYPAPPSDGSYNGGGSDRYDIYLFDLPSSAYGLTFTDSLFINGVSEPTATSFMEMDNDYQEITPYVVTNDPYLPLQAVRVTAAHEFFHFVHFGIDFLETEETINGVYGPAWMEMSAVWMEEELYDNVNDYYYYMPYFFNSAWASIQKYSSPSDLHPYATVMYPLYLSQKFNRDIIREIWLRCSPPGPSFLAAAGNVIDSMSNGTESFNSTFIEFALWNFFTGPRASWAPDYLGYSERMSYGSNFSSFKDDSVMFVIDRYDSTRLVQGNQNFLNPDHNGAFYLKLNELSQIKYDTTYWNCTAGTFPSCTDSVLVDDPNLGYDKMNVDSVLSVRFLLDRDLGEDWGLGVIFQLANHPDSTIVLRTLVTPVQGQLNFVDIINPRQYRSITMVLTPATSTYTKYSPLGDYFVSFSIPAEKVSFDSTQSNLMATFFAPYPNPAEFAVMENKVINFKFQVPTDSEGYPIYGESYSGDIPYIVVDIYNTAGEYIKTLEGSDVIDERNGLYIAEWDMKNNSDKDVASGVYIANAKLLSRQFTGDVITEAQTKVLVVR